MQVRRASLDDAEQIAHVEVASWRAAYAHLMPADYLAALSPESKAPIWRAEIEHNGAMGRKRTLVSEHEGSMTGFSFAGIPSSAPPGTGMLYFLYLLPEAWGTGTAQMLMRSVLADFHHQEVKLAYLWVLEQNARARHFYEGLGWKPDGDRNVDDYGDVSLDALRYRTRVSPMPSKFLLPP